MVIDFSNFHDLPRQMDRVLAEFMRPYGPVSRGMAYPPLNISEDEESVVIAAEIPGVDMSELDLTLTNKSLVIKGERKVEQGKYYRQERPTGPFQRIVTLGVPVDRDQIKATLKDGVLTVVLPKAEAIKPRKISIEDA
ncbi:heat shock protein Hsp20 [Alkalidesulfovibrio alkalitolerans DSM 16529]|uniref:Heat shock protein Hsp20 n=1 Tax=Alkalidesulfovibrio alkalitolerans DSM 16529 TaxID=1121439 RepID=S7URW1_9BACT|nr:Hsp20/alpha crystallin family protein [Alkalidesulfovibrio alkalitolerans]EPR35058.1 heat shock protein Hsp20 [Alkalidesulfovibrio alkalitolerans DSM 16529]